MNVLNLFQLKDITDHKWLRTTDTDQLTLPVRVHRTRRVPRVPVDLAAVVRVSSHRHLLHPTVNYWAATTEAVVEAPFNTAEELPVLEVEEEAFLHRL